MQVVEFILSNRIKNSANFNHNQYPKVMDSFKQKSKST